MTFLLGVFVRGIGCFVYADVEPKTQLLGFFPKSLNKFVIFGMHRLRKFGNIGSRGYAVTSGVI